MKIRHADLERDGDDIVAGAWDFVRRAGNPYWIPRSRDTFERHLLQLFKNPALDIIVAEHDGRIVAGIGICHVPFLWNPDLDAVEELFWWASANAPPHAAIAVLRHAIEKARETAAPREVLFTMRSMETSPNDVGRVYARLGLTHTEITHMGVI